jgi:4,5-DOPA dioxygenase extradiol
MTTGQTQPAAFIGHGSPTNALERNRWTSAWRVFGAAAPRPRAVVAVSAHWFIHATVVTAMLRPRTIHDFYGFGDELFRFEYPAPGSPEVAAEVVDAVAPRWVGLDHDSWGFDHGTWSVLAHVLPEADVPVVQLSVNALEPAEVHLEIGARLAPLRERGVMIVASGNVVHNLGRLDPLKPTDGYDWARRFDEATRHAMTSVPGDVVGLVRHPDFSLAAPTPEHFLPLLYLAGLADSSGTGADVLVEGCAMGSLSMTSYTLGGPPVAGDPDAPPASALPDASVVPPLDTNL